MGTFLQKLSCVGDDQVQRVLNVILTANTGARIGRATMDNDSPRSLGLEHCHGNGIGGKRGEGG